MKVDEQLEILSRIIILETKLAGTIEKLNQLIDSVDRRHQAISALYSGDNETPSLLSRVIELEKFNKTQKWYLGVLYTAFVSIVVTLILRKI